MTKRRLAPEEAALWAKVIASVTPIRPMAVRLAPEPLPPAAPAHSSKPLKRAPAPAPPPRTPLKPAPPPPNTLDAGWDKKLARGMVSPESTVDLHGHTLDSAYQRLDHGLEHALRRGDRVLLLVTGKPPRPESERPHARGAIRAAVGDWLAASRFSDRIAAVRGAHPQHGGSGALYIVLRRQRLPGGTKS